MPLKQIRSVPSVRSNWENAMAGAAGLWLALALIKWGNPVILDQQVPTPKTWAEIIVSAWPVSWGYVCLILVLGLAAVNCRHWKSNAPTWLLVMPVVWLGWQFVSATQTVDRTLTAATLPHFSACVAAFYLGHFALNQVTSLRLFWLGLVGGLLIVLLVGWRQHFGGFEETRRFFYSLPDWQAYPPEFLRKLSSDRIYSTLFYPNALAGVIIMLLPLSFAIMWSLGESFPTPVKAIFLLVFGALGLGCLYWSGSKAGWLILLGQSVFALSNLPFRSGLKVTAVTLVVCLGLAGLWFKHQEYFGRGATSVSARMDYWKVAWVTLTQKPIFGAGPGTFMITYREQKAPGSEMTRLVHNDFLQQGSDSGWPGFLSYLIWLAGCCYMLYRKRKRFTALTEWCVFLGLLGVMGQSCVEFGLFVPALAWSTCCLLGWLLGRATCGNRIDKPLLVS